ncbi:hypothetical protein CBR_g55020 [Chara braunii]|uniref:Reverse transcriptase n=1 Tax=Chara braunii TaxID=69332 RepID=A0A388MCG3_CHABU|nr:hypothetical protein CBR_g55020 [Chara braunii]|eukprot:GBG92251.1 hypothetical protein CBR_g55020 [Chara braunii]
MQTSQAGSSGSVGSTVAQTVVQSTGVMASQPLVLTPDEIAIQEAVLQEAQLQNALGKIKAETEEMIKKRARMQRRQADISELEEMELTNVPEEVRLVWSVLLNVVEMQDHQTTILQDIQQSLAPLVGRTQATSPMSSPGAWPVAHPPPYVPPVTGVSPYVAPSLVAIVSLGMPLSGGVTTGSSLQVPVQTVYTQTPLQVAVTTQPAVSQPVQPQGTKPQQLAQQPVSQGPQPAVLQGPGQTQWVPKTAIAAPKPFTGDKRGENLDTWLRAVPVYVRCKLTLQEEVLVAASYLEGSAARWLSGLVQLQGYGHDFRAWAASQKLEDFLKMVEERWHDPQEAQRATDAILTLHTRQFKSVREATDAVEHLICVPGVRYDPQGRVQRLSRPMESTCANKQRMLVNDYLQDVECCFLYAGGDLRHRVSFLVSDELPMDMLLGMYYLSVAQPQFDWDRKVVKHNLPGGGTARLHKFKASSLIESYGCMCPAAFYNYYKQNQEEGMYLVYVSAAGEPVKMPPEIEGVVAKYPNLFEEPTGVVEREVVHAIEIIPGSSISTGRFYRMSPGELDELRRQLKELVEKAWIRPSVSPYGSPVLFVPKKKEGTLRMCIDYRGLDAITVKNREPLLRIDDLLDRMQGCRYFSKIDLKSGYHQIAIRPEDQHKTAFQTRYGLYEFVVMPFGLCNAPGTFQHAMNRIFHDYLDKFVIVYLDDILIFSKTVEEHVAHLDKVLILLRQHKFKINGEKCEFGRTRVLRLGHEISAEGLKPDDAKVASIHYYRTLVKNYSIVAAPLTDLTWLDTPWEWTDECEAALRHLKHALTHYEVLKLPDPDKPFIVTTDASQYGIGAVLAQQEGPKLRPVEYMSKKMPSQKLAKSTYEKELYAVYKALTRWRHYLLRRPDFSGVLITEFDLTNNVTQSLVEAYREDQFMSEIIRRLEAKDKKTSAEFELVNGLLFLEKAGNKSLCVPNSESLRSLFLGECHDATGHFGYKKTTTNLLQRFWWPTMMRDAQLYVETCQVCQRDKPRTQAPLGLLKPLPIPERPGESLSMDFMDTLITNKSGMRHIFVIVDRFSKYARLVAMPETAKTEYVIRMFKENWVRDFGLPKSIVSDRDVRFTSELWKAAVAEQGTQLQMTSGNHPEANGQAEQLNRAVVVNRECLRAGAVPPKGCIYRMSEEELEVLRAQLDDLLAKGWIRPSSSPYGAPVLFVQKKNKDLRLCINYRKLNVQTVKNARPLPRIDDLLERLGNAKYFSKLDLKSGYHQISIWPSDRYKSAFKTRYGHFEWVVMPFGLTNAPTTFQAAMTNEFRAMLDRFVLVYLHDILVYSHPLEDYLGHLRRVLETLRRAKYKANRDKCQFVRQELEYLGHFVTPEGISPLSDKIQAIQEWPEPRNVTDIRSFLGLASYYQRSIKGYSTIAAHLTKLQCENRPLDFGEEVRESFLALKAALLSAEVLRIYDPLLPTRVTMDASGYGIGAVLEQHDGVDWHPIEYFSKKVFVVHSIDDARKEFLAFVHALKRWRHFLLGRSQFRWVTDNNPLVFYKTQDTVNSTIARWMSFIDHFDFFPDHIPGKSNHFADALSRRPDHCTAVYSTFEIDDDLRNSFIRGYQADPEFRDKYANCSSPNSAPSHYRIQEGYLLVHTRGKDLLCIPSDPHLRTRLLGEFHDAPGTGHFGVNRTIGRLCQRFWWPGLLGDVTRYCKSCEVC